MKELVWLRSERDSQKEHYLVLSKDLKGEEGKLRQVRGACWRALQAERTRSVAKGAWSA